MKKRILSLLLVLLLFGTVFPAPAAALPSEATHAADVLSALGLVRGDRDGYALERTATRAETVALLVRLTGNETVAKTGDYATAFTDLPDWARADISFAYASGWVSGYTVHSFAPDRLVSANDALSFLLRIVGYCDQEGDFTHDGAAVFARHMGLVSCNYTGTNAFSRGDLFQAALSALTLPQKGGKQTLLDGLVERQIVSPALAAALGLQGDGSLTARQVADRCSAAVFCLDGYQTDVAVATKQPTAHASGFFITEDGIAVTNYHTLEEMTAATATLETGECYPIERVLYYDTAIDIAVIRVGLISTKHEKTSGFATLDMQPSDTIRNGDVVYTLSNPLGLGLSVSSGVVGSCHKTVESYALPMIQNTADISQGSSGGALLNVYGQVIGITSGAFIFGNNMYLAVPIDPVLQVDLTGKGKTLPEVKAIEAAKAEKTAEK
ncbi:MAG: trypsin-like peptidase domain-containing protein [Oscillospiraceae bacterium]